MKTVKALYKLLSNERKSFLEKYPHFNPDDDKIHVLYVSPCLNATGYYRMILPMLELNRTNTHSAIITKIHKWNFNLEFEDYDNPIDKRLIEWAHYIVFPVIFTPMDYIIEAIRAINQNISFVMDIDINYFVIPENNLNATKITEAYKSNLLKNILQMNMLTGVSKLLLTSINEHLVSKQPEHKVRLASFPNLISKYSIENIDIIKHNQSDKTKIGILANSAGYHDVLKIKNVIKHINNKYNEKVEFILLGWNGKLPDGQDISEELSMTVEKSVSFLKYLTNVNKLTFDIVLLFQENTPFNLQKSYAKCLEICTFAAAIIASKKSPFSTVIIDEENGLLAGSENEWIDKISKLIDNKSYRIAMGERSI